MKEIITLDRADQPYGYPQLDEYGNLKATGSLYGTSSYALTASFALNGGGSGNGITASFQMFMNPQTITENIDIPAEYNAFVLGPVGISSSINVGSGSYLAIL